MRLSDRMEAIAAMVTDGNVVADVGTDHGYIPIALMTRGRIHKAIAMDLREGPLSRAKEHIVQYGLQDGIDTRLSDGVAALAIGEADTIVIAGMGGELVIHILTDGAKVCKHAKELILQPQSELAEVRAFLREQGYEILDENIIEEDGKFYPMMRVASCEKESVNNTEDVSDADILVEDAYGPVLLQKGHPVLQQFLAKQQKQLEKIMESLQKQPQSGLILRRMQQVDAELCRNRRAQQIMGQQMRRNTCERIHEKE